MRNLNPGVELPVASPKVLPYVELYRRSFPLISLFPIATMMIATVGIILAPSHNMIMVGGSLLDLFSFAAIALIILKTTQKKQKTGLFLGADTKEFMEAVSERYQITLTESILERLVQGGTTKLLDKNGELKRIMIDSSPETRTTKLVAVELR